MALLRVIIAYLSFVIIIIIISVFTEVNTLYNLLILLLAFVRDPPLLLGLSLYDDDALPRTAVRSRIGAKSL